MPTCPNCDTDFEKLIAKKCPNCETELKRVRVKEGKLNVSRYVLISEPAEEVVEEEKAEIGELFFQSDGVKIFYRGKNEEGRKLFTAYFNVWVERVVCPECRLLAFKPRIPEGEIEHKCNKCKSITMFIFDVFHRGRVA